MSSIPPSNEPENPKENGPSNRDRYENFLGHFSGNARDIVAYILLFVGIILLFLNPLYGGLLIGVVAGIYFSKEIVHTLTNVEQFIDNEGLARSIILGALLLAFLISAPAIFLGIAVVVLLRFFILNEKG